MKEKRVVQNKSNLSSKEDKREMPQKEKLGESDGSAGRKTLRELKFECQRGGNEEWKGERSTIRSRMRNLGLFVLLLDWSGG